MRRHVGFGCGRGVAAAAVVVVAVVPAGAAALDTTNKWTLPTLLPHATIVSLVAEASRQASRHVNLSDGCAVADLERSWL